MQERVKGDIIFCDLEVEDVSISARGQKTRKRETLKEVVYKIGNPNYKEKRVIRIIKERAYLGKSVV